MAEVVTAVAWEECDAIVMVTIVLLVIWVCGTVPKNKKKRFKKMYIYSIYVGQKLSFDFL